ncbi:hypothetical protein BJ742DRAFT_738313 [Cladochytrium replicatum]|nr:hypothetical protein BJ742DRAFT_738313 [Cladochytrium replicatum]
MTDIEAKPKQKFYINSRDGEPPFIGIGWTKKADAATKKPDSKGKGPDEPAPKEKTMFYVKNREGEPPFVGIGWTKKFDSEDKESTESKEKRMFYVNNREGEPHLSELGGPASPTPRIRRRKRETTIRDQNHKQLAKTKFDDMFRYPAWFVAL